jgi:hypothetical protein
MASPGQLGALERGLVAAMQDGLAAHAVEQVVLERTLVLEIQLGLALLARRPAPDALTGRAAACDPSSDQRASQPRPAVLRVPERTRSCDRLPGDATPETVRAPAPPP